MPRLFVYGTLLFPEIRRALLGRKTPAEPAKLKNFRRTKIYRDERELPYPALIPKKDSMISGEVIFLNRRELELLDHYEGNEYDRIQVMLIGGKYVWAYVWNFSSHGTPGKDWDNKKFRRCCLRHYMRKLSFQ